MNDMFGWLIQKAVWLGLVTAVLVSVTGCGDSGLLSRQSSDDSVPGDPNIGLSEFAQDLPRLRGLIDEGNQASENGELDEAIETYTTVLRRPWSESVDRNDIRTLNAEVFYLRGQAFLAKGFPQIAIDDFDDAIGFEDDELNSKVYLQRARAASSLSFLSQAVADCARSIRLDPNNGVAFLVRGRALEDWGRPLQAEQSFLEAERLGVVFQRSLKPPLEPTPSPLDQANKFMDAGSPGLAIEILTKSIRDGDDNWEMSGLLAQAQFQMQEFYPAFVASDRAIDMNPLNADAYRVRGLSHLRREDFDRAISDLNAAIVLDASLAEQLQPSLNEARQRGGIDPVVRTAMVSRIQKAAAVEPRGVSSPSQSERWLLELISKRKSVDRIEQFKALLAETPESEFDSLQWLADFLMMDYRVPGVLDLRNYLDGRSPDVSRVEERLWESVKSPIAAASFGVNVFPDLAEYAMEYKFLGLLRKSIDSDICEVDFDHVYQSIENENSEFLKLVLQPAELLDRDATRLLRYCVEKNRKQHAMLIINQRENSLTWQVIQFLDLAE